MENSSAKAVRSFMATVVVGTLICELVTVLVFAVIGRFELGVIWGALWGTAVMVIYYLMFALAITKAASGDPESAKKRSMGAYSRRMLVLLVLMGLGLFLSTRYGILNWIPMLLAVFFPRIAIGLRQGISDVKKMFTEEGGKGE